MSPPSSPALQRLNRLDRSSPGFPDKFCDVLYGQEYVECKQDLGNDDLAWLVHYLDKTLDRLDPSSLASWKCLRELRSTCGTRVILPKSHTLPSSRFLQIDPEPFASGDFCDVYQGTLGGSTKVCVKRVRMYVEGGSQKGAKFLCEVAVIWKRLTHPNVLPLLGVTTTPLQFISNLVPGGTLPEYIQRHPQTDRRGLLSDVAEGIRYIHSCNVIHRDIKGVNILVENSGRACITGFHFAKIAKDLDSLNSMRDAPELYGYTVRWVAPEVLSREECGKEADIFSFAMVMIEVFTDAVRSSGHQALMAMLYATQGKRPSRPTHPTFTEELWTLMQRCWDHDPHLRPEASEVLQVLTPNPPAWKRLIDPTLHADERIDLIKSIFSDRGEVEVFKSLSRDDSQTFVDIIYEVLGSIHHLPLDIYRRCLRSLYGICGRKGLLPKSLLIPLCYDPMGTAQCSGGFADVWKGEHDGRDVAAKAVRVYAANDLERIRKGFCKEVVTWKTLRHPNVLPLLGVTMTESPLRFVMVSEWMESGNIVKFLQCVDADRLKLLADATKGLIYMHDQGIIHGDLKGPNIMIDNTGRAVLADFSLVALIPDQSTFRSTCIQGGSIPWMGPELLNPEDYGLQKGWPTRESDCYALGMVVYEILSGCNPYGANNQFVIITKILSGERPKRPRGVAGELFTDGIWAVAERCWKAEPSERASAKDVLVHLEEGSLAMDRGGRESDGASTDFQDPPDESGVAEKKSASSITAKTNRPLVLVLDPPRNASPSPAVDSGAHSGYVTQTSGGSWVG